MLTVSGRPRRAGRGGGCGAQRGAWFGLCEGKQKSLEWGVEGAELEAQQVKYRRGESAAAKSQNLGDLNSCFEFYHLNIPCVVFRTVCK